MVKMQNVYESSGLEECLVSYAPDTHDVFVQFNSSDWTWLNLKYLL